MTDKIRQCWAFHRDGMRCEHPAGHAGDHMVAKTWNDLQCATPGEFEPAQGFPVPAVAAVVVPKGVEVVTKCVACSHAHKSGVCKCGCHEFIG